MNSGVETSYGASIRLIVIILILLVLLIGLVMFFMKKFINPVRKDKNKKDDSAITSDSSDNNELLESNITIGENAGISDDYVAPTFDTNSTSVNYENRNEQNSNIYNPYVGNGEQTDSNVNQVVNDPYQMPVQDNVDNYANQNYMNNDINSTENINAEGNTNYNPVDNNIGSEQNNAVENNTINQNGPVYNPINTDVNNINADEASDISKEAVANNIASDNNAINEAGNIDNPITEDVNPTAEEVGINNEPNGFDNTASSDTNLVDNNQSSEEAINESVSSNIVNPENNMNINSEMPDLEEVNIEQNKHTSFWSNQNSDNSNQ